LAVEGDSIGFLGKGDPENIDVIKVHIMLDLPESFNLKESGSDLVVCHHPPIFQPEIPVYVVHSNWDIVNGGANDALAKCLNLDVLGVLDDETGIGRICAASTTIPQFIKTVSASLPMDHVTFVPGNTEDIHKVAVVSGFGLNPKFIDLAADKGADLYISGDLDHKSALYAQKLGINLLDATHYATEIPGLMDLNKLISELNVETELICPGVPWKVLDME
ncbi:MAG: Nif3-like dinuclear metal center hexameric protein, partial [Methanobacterium paludis]|nr:Nif3-like dinuclear metal center hexameric protein [Methanobacterium paludis]